MLKKKRMFQNTSKVIEQFLSDNEVNMHQYRIKYRL